ncbi:vacuolar amino acid transporter 1 [Pyrenophora seminiperda CCB06]|uniref:Vacuolar amino acid transporter 1 n=1 Tax=Pyrenophora seminiperda CCB06 TaxID=1302712 RepID=A0A3M7LVI6_9PLEO|nr:vacuolar amino acid transporter 1 [Pyrenophora seminiperda CCB06]
MSRQSFFGFQTPASSPNMKRPFIALVLITAVVHARVALPSETSIENFTRYLGFTVPQSGNDSTVHTTADISKFDKSVEIGRTLGAACNSKDSVARWFFKNFPNFADTCQSPFEGDARDELKTWGFDDSDELSKDVEKECDFDEYHHIKDAFDELGLDTKSSKDGGPNRCVKINHRDSLAIKRNEDGSLPSEENQYYEATGATYEFAVNPNGMVGLMNIMSMTYCAEKFTWKRKPKSGELPHIGTPSDIAWVSWNRVATDITGIKYLVVTQVINADSRDIYKSALRTLDPPQSEFKQWPGHEFDMNSNGGLAILVGRWAGYFLLQHKGPLGGNRFISKVRIFVPPRASMPYLVFYVDPTPVQVAIAKDVAARVPGAVETELKRVDSRDSARVVRKSADGKNVVRQHTVFG